MTTQAQNTAQSASLSEAIRAASGKAHGAAQTSTFMGDLFRGNLDRDRYGRYVAQLHAVYAALERASAHWQDDPVAGPFVRPELNRLDAIENDLVALLGPGWQDTTSLLPVTAEYTARLDDAAQASSAAFVAHHYVRYLGDLSGGQAIRTVVEKAYGEGTATALTFEAIADTDAFKQQYRSNLDEAPWNESEQQRVIDEVLVAYDLNTRLLAAM